MCQDQAPLMPDTRPTVIPGSGLERVLVIGLGAAAVEELLRDEPGIGADGTFDGVGDGGIVPEEELGVLAPLPEALAVIGEPGPRLLDDAGLDAEVDELAGL